MTTYGTNRELEPNVFEDLETRLFEEHSYRKFKLEKWKMIALVIGVIVVISFVIIMLSVFLHKTASVPNNICMATCERTEIECTCASFLPRNQTSDQLISIQLSTINSCKSLHGLNLDLQNGDYCAVVSSTDGCPFEHPQNNLYLRSDSGSTSCKPPYQTNQINQNSASSCATLFHTYFVDKFPASSGSGSPPASHFITQKVADFLNTTASDLLTVLNNLNQTVKADTINFIRDNSFGVVGDGGVADDFAQDLYDEIIGSSDYYFNFQWGNPPEFQKVLPDNDPLLQPSINIHTPEREKWRNDTIQQILAQGRPAPAGRKPRIFFIGGGPATGKTTTVKGLNGTGIYDFGHGTLYVNPDDILEMDPIYQQIAKLGDFRAADVVHSDSAAMGAKLLSLAFQNKMDIILDTTLSQKPKSVELLRTADANGYDSYIIAVTVNPEVAMMRSYMRAKYTFRFVPSSSILRDHSLFSQNFEQYLPYVKEALLFDTDFWTPQKIMLWSAETNNITVFNQTLYNAFNFKKGLNMNATNTLQLYGRDPKTQEYIYPPAQQLSKFLGGCSVGSDYVDRYSRIYSVLQMVSNEDSKHQVCMCTNSNKDSNTSTSKAREPAAAPAPAPAAVSVSMPQSSFLYEASRIIGSRSVWERVVKNPRRVAL